jgi:hypothetical protein
MVRAHSFQRLIIQSCFWRGSDPMSALGQKQTLRAEISMSALPPKADIGGVSSDVRFVPKADIPSAVPVGC